MEGFSTLRQWILESKRTVFFGGAGVSTESGIPDFRSVDGLYRQRWKYPPETIISRGFFERNPEEFFRFYREKMIFPNAKPNPAHLALAALEKRGLLSSVVTQNIDGLHQQAGSGRVMELHGSIHRNHCQKCLRFHPLSDIMTEEAVPRCACGGIIKPDVVLYEEPLEEKVLQAAIAEISQAELLLIGGTSLSVYPAAGLVDMFHGKHLAIINKSPTPKDRGADLCICGPIGETLMPFLD